MTASAAWLSLLVLLGGLYAGVQNPDAQSPEAIAQAAELRAIVQRAPRLPLKPAEIRPTPPRDGWAMGMVSWVAADRNGLIYLLQRGDKADPVVVIERDGKVVRSWGAGHVRHAARHPDRSAGQRVDHRCGQLHGLQVHAGRHDS